MMIFIYELGLTINKSKSSTLIFGMENKPISVGGIETVHEMKYLGVTINDNMNDSFKSHKSSKLDASKKLSNMTYSVIYRSCNKLLIGKTYWKTIVLPSLLFASSVFVWNKDELEKLQRSENSVWRHLLGCPGYTPIAAMRGDIGSSCMYSRDMKSKLKYARYIMNDACDLVRRVFELMFED